MKLIRPVLLARTVAFHWSPALDCSDSRATTSWTRRPTLADNVATLSSCLITALLYGDNTVLNWKIIKYNKQSVFARSIRINGWMKNAGYRNFWTSRISNLGVEIFWRFWSIKAIGIGLYFWWQIVVRRVEKKLYCDTIKSVLFLKYIFYSTYLLAIDFVRYEPAKKSSWTRT